MPEARGAPPATEGRAAEGKAGPAATNISGLIRGLHEGRIGGTNFRWLNSIVAVGLIVLSLTGIYIVLPHRRASSKRRY